MRHLGLFFFFFQKQILADILQELSATVFAKFLWKHLSWFPFLVEFHSIDSKIGQNLKFSGKFHIQFSKYRKYLRRLIVFGKDILFQSF